MYAYYFMIKSDNFFKKKQKTCKDCGYQSYYFSFNIVSSISRRHSFVHIFKTVSQTHCHTILINPFLSLLKYAYMWVHAWTSLFHKDINDTRKTWIHWLMTVSYYFTWQYLRTVARSFQIVISEDFNSW